MKKLNKILLALLAFIAAGFVASSFVSCSDDDDDNGPSLVATYKSSVDADNYSYVYCYSDNTFKSSGRIKDVIEEGSDFYYVIDMFFATGTYSGNPTADGTVSFTTKKEANTDESVMETKVTEAVAAGKSSVTFTNSDFPLTAVTSEETFQATISGTTLTLPATDEDDEEEVYTRQ